MNFKLNIYSRDINNDELLNDLKNVAKILNKTSVTMDEYKNKGKYGCSIFKYRFGSWTNACKSAKLDLSNNRDINSSDLIDDLKAVAEKLDKTSILRDEYVKY